MRRMNQKGFSLLEMLLVLAIISSLLVLGLNYTVQKTEQTRRDMTVLQLQQMADAALAYYINNGSWPIDTCTAGSWSGYGYLTASGYIPAKNNPYGNGFGLSCASNTGNFFISTGVRTSVNASIIAGQLPWAFTNNTYTPDYSGSSTKSPTPAGICAVASPDPSCQVVIMSIPPPGQNLNNARSVNFAGIYTHNQCVPVPACPSGMIPQIFVAPAGVTGANDYTGSATQQPVKAYPINSFSAYALPPASPPNVSGCSDGGYADTCGQTSGFTTGDRFWRVCLSISTEKGKVSPPTTKPYEQDTVNMGSIIAITRCAPTNEITGSKFTVYSP